MRKLSHNKKRNLGLVYEFLTREVTDAAVARNSARAAAALGIMERHLADGRLLYPELSLHRQVVATRGVNERMARRLVDELKAAGIRGSAKRELIERAKSDLIHEMNRTLGRDVFDRYRVPDYTVHASIGILLARGISGRIDEGIELARIEEHLVSYLTSHAVEREHFDRDASLYAYRTAVGLFEQEFGRRLGDGQGELLREYVRFSLGGNPAPFERVFERQRADLRTALRARRADDVFCADSEMAGRLDEAIASLESLPARPNDESVEQLMLYHNLRAEIES